MNSKCKYVTPGYACYAVSQVVTKPNQAGFGAVGGKAYLDNMDSITTSLPKGGALLMGLCNLRFSATHFALAFRKSLGERTAPRPPYR